MLLIDRLSGKPVYEQIIDGMERHILLGVYQPGTLIPSLREMSASLGINPNTVQKSYNELIRRGVIISTPGNGTYVASDALERIRDSALRKLPQLEELVGELALSGVPKREILATVSAVYARNAPDETTPTGTMPVGSKTCPPLEPAGDAEKGLTDSTEKEIPDHDCC